jgi:quinol monooxygenase YgiN
MTKHLYIPFLLILNLYGGATIAKENNDLLKESKMKEASYIKLVAKAGKQKELADFLIVGANLVKETEPKTLLWAALKNDNEMVIFDAFADTSSRDAHFAGKVAAALNANAENLVDGGWDKGVVANIKNPKILSAKNSNNAGDMKKAVFISFTAKEGQTKKLVDFLISGADIVKQTEPKTSYWYALQFSDNEFGIVDFFADQSGIDAHFAGKVAAAVKENADALIVGGWEDGVVANIRQFDVLAITHRSMEVENVTKNVLKTSAAWIKSFNKGDIKACSEGYSENAVMDARPMGQFKGRAAIHKFWTGFVESTKATDLVYTDIKIDVIDEKSAVLSANWSMNVGRGFITKELWVKTGEDWFLLEDDFTVEEQY